MLEETIPNILVNCNLPALSIGKLTVRILKVNPTHNERLLAVFEPASFNHIRQSRPSTKFQGDVRQRNLQSVPSEVRNGARNTRAVSRGRSPLGYYSCEEAKDQGKAGHGDALPMCSTRPEIWWNGRLSILTRLQTCYPAPSSYARYRTSSSTHTRYIHKQSFPLAVPAPTQSIVGWNLATAGTAVILSPPSCANCCPFPV
jgi:hypothetical protein